MVNAISTVVGEAPEGHQNMYLRTVSGNNGYLYCIPYRARRVAKFNPADKAITDIGPDLGDGAVWYIGAMTDSGVIYCPPDSSNRGILKIVTNTDTVTELDRNLLPEQGYDMWTSCAAALDGYIYCMPLYARRIMKLDPNDAISSVGDDLGGEHGKYSGTVVGIDGCVYGIPRYSKRIIQYDPIKNDTTSNVGEEADVHIFCKGNGALRRDGCIYAITWQG